MANEIGKIELNFEIVDTGNPKMLIVHDFSKWRVIEKLPAYMEVTIPGSRKPTIQPFKKYTTTGYNSLTLGLSCHIDCQENLVDLPDGIYEFCLRGGKEGERQKSKYYLKKDKFQLDFDEILTKLPSNYQDTEFNMILDFAKIDSLMDSAEANARKGFIKDANDYFILANKIMKQYKECKNCI